jgi:hypothetical protein
MKKYTFKMNSKGHLEQSPEGFITFTCPDNMDIEFDHKGRIRCIIIRTVNTSPVKTVIALGKISKTHKKS